MLTLPDRFLKPLRTGKNLLGFSGGFDSSALFHLLQQHGIAFDIALVNYGRRPESAKEESWARSLAAQHNKIAHIHHCQLPNSNFEHEARQVRYQFFESIIHAESYDHLLLAHQLNDRLEWLLMQLCKGAGAVELLGMQAMEERKGYRIIRPLLEASRSDIEAYLKQHDIRCFYDSSNGDSTHWRNAIRQQFAAPLIENHIEGIKRSFRFLEDDSEQLLPKTSLFSNFHGVLIAPIPDSSTQLMRLIDRGCKQLGIVPSQEQKQTILQQKNGVLSGKITICITETLLFICPYVSDSSMEKHFKEQCRIAGIPPKVRGYLHQQSLSLDDLGLLLRQFT